MQATGTRATARPSFLPAFTLTIIIYYCSGGPCIKDGKIVGKGSTMCADT